MTLIVLRLAGTLQSWAGYRHQVNMKSSVPTAPVPRKSAVSGLIGAALGPVDSGFGSARDLKAIGERFEMDVRIEARNPLTEDFQVLGPLRPRDEARADFMGRLANANTSAFPRKRSGGNFETAVSRRDFLAHSEFIVTVNSDEATVNAWWQALRQPVFMPYLGRRSCAPSFPFLLGVHSGDAQELFAALPHVDKYRRAPEGLAALSGYRVRGDYDLHHAEQHSVPYSPVTIHDRAEQLTWAKENLLT